ncbi:MAG: acyl-CoA dehydrogenase [Nannocystaceae bacterium]
MTDTERTPLDDPKFLPFLPMLYVAWADSELDAEEINAIREAMPASARCLDPWLDPDDPPSAAEMGRLLALLRGAAENAATAEKLDLVGLGRCLAQAHQEDEAPISAHEREALERIAAHLGVVGTEAARQLLASRRGAKQTPEPPPSFDVEALARRLVGDRAEVRRRVLELLAAPEFRLPVALDRESHREQVLAWCRRLADAGLGALSFPRSAGGEADLEAFLVAFEAIAFHDLSLLIKFGVQFGLFGGAIVNLGTARHHAEYLPRARSLELPGCFAMTETSHGSNVADLETTATWDPSARGFIIDTPSAAARKDYIGNAARDGRVAVVFAQLRVGAEEHGVHAFVVPIRGDDGGACPGVTITDCGHKMGLNGVDNGRLRFDRVRVPRGALLDRFASVSEEGVYQSPIASPTKRFFTMLGTLVGGRVSVALAANSAAKSALTIAVKYAVQRRQFGPGGEQELKLLDYPIHRRKLLPYLATTYALGFALAQLRRDYAEAMDAEVDDDAAQSRRRQVEADAAGLKAYSTDHCTETIQTCRKGCGGQGYLAENRFAALKADTDVFMTFEGDNTVLSLLVAKGMLTQMRDRLKSAGVRGFARWIAARANHEAERLRPWKPRRTSREHLQDHDFHLDALRWREEDLVTEVAQALRRQLHDGDPSDALLAVQNQMLAMANARVERQILERFVAAVEATEDGGERQILAQLCQLFALCRIEADRAYFLENGYFAGRKSRVLRDEVDRLCAALRPQASHLVDAFAIPEELLAPIAR